MNKKKPNKRVIKFVDMSEKKPNKRKSPKELFASEKKPNKRKLSKANKDTRNKRYMLEKDRGLKAKAKVLNESIQWWEQRMNDAFAELDRLEEKEDSFDLNFDLEDELQKIIDKIQFLARRGEIETRNTRALESEIDDFLKECQGFI